MSLPVRFTGNPAEVSDQCIRETYQMRLLQLRRTKLKKILMLGLLLVLVVYLVQSFGFFNSITPSSKSSRWGLASKKNNLLELRGSKENDNDIGIDAASVSSSMITTSGPHVSDIKELHGVNEDVILIKNMELSLRYKDKIVMTGNLNYLNSLKSTPIDCHKRSMMGACYEWPGEARFTIGLSRSKTNEMDCFDLEWTALRCVDQVFTDCFDIGSAHWYGGYENKQQYWPLNKNNLTLSAYVSHSIVYHPVGNVLERYFFSSNGTGIYIDSEVPFYLSLNKPHDMMCFTAKYDSFAYNNYDNKYPVLKYKICQADNVKTIHSKMAAMFIKKPSNIPDVQLFRYPVWSTWAEFRKEVNQSAVLKFANDILENKFPHSQLEIDDLWTPTCGDYEFDPTKFPKAPALIHQLNAMGFRVTVWVHPFFNIDSSAFTEGASNSYFLQSYNTTRPALIKWWDGNLAGILDPTNPDAVNWYLGKLDNLKKVYNISSFKFDAGEAGYLPPMFSSYGQKRGRNDIYPKAYVKMAVQSDKSRHLEVRAGYQTQQYPVFIRIMDKYSQWDHNNGIESVIPVVLTFGILGYPFVLPDMIAGNQKKMKDPELYIRWVELNTFLPSMQFSVVPWRFNESIVKAARKYTMLHEQFSPLFIKFAQDATATGFPIIRPIWWLDPDSEDALTCEDEFLVGEEILVAPVVKQGARGRDIYLPPGTWHDELRDVNIDGGKWLRNYRVDLEELAYFQRIASEEKESTL